MSLWTSARLRRYPQDAGQDQASYVQWLIARGEPARLRPRSLAGLSGASARGAEKHEPLFSVVVPVFRPPLWGLERCVVSVLTQRFGNFELKICDDCGGDRDVVELLRRCEAMDDRLELVVSDRNGGISDATNRALALATGKYVVFLDHDDELAEDALSVIAAAINARPEADVLYSDSDKISAGGQRFAPASEARVVTGPVVLGNVPGPRSRRAPYACRKGWWLAERLRRQPGSRPSASCDGDCRLRRAHSPHPLSLASRGGLGCGQPRGKALGA